MNKYRTNKLPTRSDIIYIMKHFETNSFHDIRKVLNVSDTRLLEWFKILFDVGHKEQRWREIEDNLNAMELMETMDDNLASDYHVHHIKRIGKHRYAIVKKIINPTRMFYIVTVNDYNYLVKFDSPVEKDKIKYSPELTGVDYSVDPVGQWEYLQLQDSLPVVEIAADEFYIGNFWLAFNEMKQYA